MMTGAEPSAVSSLSPLCSLSQRQPQKTSAMAVAAAAVLTDIFFMSRIIHPGSELNFNIISKGVIDFKNKYRIAVYI